MRAIVCVMTWALLTVPAFADENGDLDFIPVAAAEKPAVPPSSAGKLQLEDDVTANQVRGVAALPPPPPAPANWQNRTSLDGRGSWRLSDRITVDGSDRLNLLAQNGLDYPSHRNVGNDFREGFVTWEPVNQAYVEVGRINVKNGAALGFNPTDFFKTRSLVDLASQDPAARRDDRLGSFMLRSQRIWDGGSASLAVAPKIASASQLSAAPPPRLDPLFEQTNATTRLLLSGNVDITKDLSPQVLVLRDDSGTRFGANLSHGIGDAVIAYAEWAGGRQASLAGRAEAFGKQTGTLPGAAPALLSSGEAASFQNDLALGGSWTSAAKVTVNLEYHYHQAGFSRQDWNRWFAAGRTGPSLDGELWYLRAYAADQQEPNSRQEGFIRIDWADAFIRDLELAAFADVNLCDGSALAQLSANYYLSNAWTLGVLAAANIGAAQSEHGSLPQAASAILQIVRYF